MQDTNKQDGVPLEVRMRNLILQNSTNAQTEGSAANVPRSSSSAFISPPAAGDANLSGSSQEDQQKAAHKTGKKRMNQAQRRQMSSQLSVSIDPRATESQPNQALGNSSSANYRHNNQHRNQRSQSAAWRPPHVNDGFARHNPSPSYPGVSSSPGLFDWRPQNEKQNGFSGNQPGYPRPNHAAKNWGSQSGALYNPRLHAPRVAGDLGAQVALLEQLCAEIRANAEINYEQIKEKEDFRLLIEDACRVAITHHEVNVNGRNDFFPLSVQLRCFGSLSSGFATKSSDMDLGLLSPLSHPQPDSRESPIPRLIEKTFLEMGLGARLLSKTRVPIIKVCQKPPGKLYTDLLEEREKWEKGVDDDQEFEDEDGKEGRHKSDHDVKNVTKVRAGNDAHGAIEGQLDETSGTVYQGSDEYQTTLHDLRQGAKNLSNYYTLAKKVLRKLGGKDITNSTAAGFSENDYRILNDVCRTFVHGLADADLRRRLEEYASLSFDGHAQVPLNRTIFGVLTQIEGEKMVIAFESREIREKDQHHEQMARNRVTHWRELQNRPNCGLDPLGFNKELLSSIEYLKRTPSIGLSILEQGQYEPAAVYHRRVIRLLNELGGQDLSTSQSPILPVVIRQYVQGISDQGIRAQIVKFLGDTQSPTLRTVARRHKSLLLAREFERALEKSLYSAEYIDNIQAYIELLRGPMVTNNTSGDVQFGSVLPMSPEGWRLLAKMREVPDPSRMSPNQPPNLYNDKLELPKSGVGVQCDINFSAQLALHNTHLLRCYSLTDDRVRPLVLFVKHWAKVRGINTPYRGTLSSYGYVLMVLHYLVNVARPFVCPNLQLMAPPVDPNLTPEQIENTVNCRGHDVRFWRDENHIANLAQQGRLNENKESIGYLLRGFFEYYGQGGVMSIGAGRGFDWGRDVISLRSRGGILSKQDKGWTGAKTVLEVQSSNRPPATEPEMPQANPNPMVEEQGNRNLAAGSHPQPSPDSAAAAKPLQDRSKSEVKEVRHRFLFAIEDPFELEHNVARTVTHNGIVSIRDEFRRAWAMIKNAGRFQNNESLLQDSSRDVHAENATFQELLDEIHGQPPS